MAQADFAYDRAEDATGLPMTVSLYADRVDLLEQIRGDAAAAGLRIGDAGPLAPSRPGSRRTPGRPPRRPSRSWTASSASIR